MTWTPSGRPIALFISAGRMAFAGACLWAAMTFGRASFPTRESISFARPNEEGSVASTRRRMPNVSFFSMSSMNSKRSCPGVPNRSTATPP
ncbi:Uncharacterised protein [uncultured archaeon]|nr:Uncharacterised protein [uncultured archaeon]